MLHLAAVLDDTTLPKYGLNHVTTLIEQKAAKLAAIAHDVEPSSATTRSWSGAGRRHHGHGVPLQRREKAIQLEQA